MKVVSAISTKGGVGKTTVAASLGGFAADAGKRVLMVDLDRQPTLSSYFPLSTRAPGGVFELLACNERRAERVVSHTTIANLDVILSNDDQRQLDTMLLNAADGRLRLRHLLAFFQQDYDLALVDTQGARSVLLEAAVLASELAISPVTPEILAARELQRGTIQLLKDVAPFRHWGITPPPLLLLINRVHAVSANARVVQQALREAFPDDEHTKTLRTTLPALEAYQRAATMGVPVHRVERRRPHGRQAASALETMRSLMLELFPSWTAELARVSGTARDVENLHA